jgi:acetyl esterase/lipase
VVTVPVGYLVTVVLAACCILLGLAPLREPAFMAGASFRVGLVINELPFLVLYYLLASTLLAFGQGDINSAAGWSVVCLAAVATLGLAVILWRGLRAGPAAARALSEELGAEPPRRRLPLGRILLAPFFVRRRDVGRVSDRSYGDAGVRNQLDLYRHRSHPAGCPTLIHLHGGRFIRGRKSREALPLIYRLAGQGWVCISANYRLSPEATFPDHLVDAKRVIAWVREHADEYGVDPSAVFVAGSSAGGHIAAMAALTPNDPAFQPGFEDADTGVAAAICLGAYFGPLATADPAPSSPLAHLGPRSNRGQSPVGCRHERATAIGRGLSPVASAGVPPFFVAHGDRDTVVFVEGARAFVEKLRAASDSPVVYLELPGGQHAFDLFHSVRFERVVDAIDAFATWVRSARATQGAR